MKAFLGGTSPLIPTPSALDSVKRPFCAMASSSSVTGPEGPHARDCAQKVELVGYRRTNEPTPVFASQIVVRAISAELYRSFDKFGRMDPFALVDWCYEDGRIVSIGRTRTATRQHMHPVWEHSCKLMPYSGNGSGDKIKFQVLEENFGGLAKSTFCGDAMVPVDALLSGARTISPGLMQTQPQPVALYKRGENTGQIVIQILIHLPESQQTSETQFTYVETKRFVTPVRRLGVSGGTAPFFSLQLAAAEGKSSGDYWIGKDLSRAMDEVQFYEKVKSLSKRASHEIPTLYNFMFQYDGILKATEEGVDDAGELELLVLQNMRHGRNSLRLLDIKVGEKTAAPNWMGKSRLAALRQGLIDEHTNSQAEGFRLEGFDGQTPVLLSMDPLLDLGGEEGHSKSTQKKARRLMLQRLPAAEMLMHYMDLHSYDVAKPPSTELAEVVMDETCKQLVGLTVACCLMQAPQKWIGSSVALGFDDGFSLPAYADGQGFTGEDEAQLRKTSLVKIFDWGRSELNTLEEHSERSAEEQQDRLDFWRLYVGGIQRLAWEAARHYRHRFGNPNGWKKAQLVVYDFDSMTDSDFIGQVFVDLVETSETTASLLTADGSQVSGKEGPSTLTFSISWRRFAEQSRLQGAWSVRIFRAEKLPACDSALWPSRASSDPFVKVFAFSEDESFQCVQRSTVKVKNLDPVWDETFDLPVAKPEHASLEAIVGSPKADASKIGVTLPPVPYTLECPKAEAEGLEQWKELMHLICGRQNRSFLV
eukprot:symbB.v1.2.010141.t1/scaffold618.1/size180184/18